MSLLASLPAPKREVAPLSAPQPSSSSALASSARPEPPPYRRRKNFIPRKPEDFGDGGAFPEIHVAQYPLEMGKNQDPSSRGNQTLAVTVNADGEVNFDAVIRSGQNKNKIIHATHKALVPKIDAINGEGLTRPDEDEIEKAKAETAAALLGVVEKKLAINQPKALPTQPGAASYIKYTPSQQGAQFASGAGQRIIKMQDMPVDPLEPPKFRHTKAPRGPGSPPVPVMHSPPRPVSAAEMADWKIPPSISNWKNPKGYTIPLDKRLAADGRGLQVQQINDKFASLAESLQLAEKKAREQIEYRNRVTQEVKAAEKARKEQELRELAMKARQERAGGLAGRMEGGEQQGGCVVMLLWCVLLVLGMSGCQPAVCQPGLLTMVQQAWCSSCCWLWWSRPVFKQAVHWLMADRYMDE
jgi:SNW domain-containing protein 1